ncbi:hypothetical protein [Spirosoma gilvum]
MRFFNWLGLGSSKSQADELSRAIAGELITIEWHEEDKKQTAAWIAERRALAAQKRLELSEGARYWFDQSENEEINRLEHSIQWNEQIIAHAKNVILYRRQQLSR